MGLNESDINFAYPKNVYEHVLLKTQQLYYQMTCAHTCVQFYTVCMHAYMRSHMRCRARIHTHTASYSRTYTRMHMCTHTLPPPHTYPVVVTHTHRCTQMRTDAHRCAHTYMLRPSAVPLSPRESQDPSVLEGVCLQPGLNGTVRDSSPWLL